MRKMSIAQLREAQVNRFCRDFETNYKTAKHVFNLFYRLAYQRETEVIIDNDYRLYSEARSNREAAETEKRHKRLLEVLKPFNLSIRYYGIFPTIYDDTENRDYSLDCYMYEREVY